MLAEEKEKKEQAAQTMALLEQWVVARYYQRPYEVREWVSYKFPESFDIEKLVKFENPDPSMPEKMVGPSERYRRRDGFKLTTRVIASAVSCMKPIIVSFAIFAKKTIARKDT